MKPITLPTKRKFSWKVLLIVLALVLIGCLMKVPMAIANGYADQPSFGRKSFSVLC